MRCVVELEEWGCASEIKQKIKQNQGYALWNGERGSSEFSEKLEEALSYRKGTKKFGSESGGVLVKKGCKKGGG